MEPFALTAGILFIIFMVVGFFASRIESLFDDNTINQETVHYFTISENFKRCRVLGYIIGIIAFVLLLIFPIAVRKYTQIYAIKQQTTVNNLVNNLAIITSFSGLATMLSLYWMTAESTFHMAMACLTFLLTWLTLCALATHGITKYIAILASLGVFVATIFGLQNLTLSLTGMNQTRKNGIGVAIGEFILVLSITIFMFVAATAKPAEFRSD